MHEINTALNKSWQTDDKINMNLGVLTKEEKTASAIVSKSLPWK